jgi:hypothetical protein
MKENNTMKVTIAEDALARALARGAKTCEYSSDPFNPKANRCGQPATTTVFGPSPLPSVPYEKSELCERHARMVLDKMGEREKAA